MIFTEKEMTYITSAFSVSVAELQARGMLSELEYVTGRIKEADKLTDKPHEYLQHILVTFEYLQEVLND